jgi:SRSO17 transposase
MPLVHQRHSSYLLPNIVYGGIDYKQQFDVLKQYSNNNQRTYFSDSILGHSLNALLMQSLNDTIVATSINNNTNNYKNIALNRNLKNATVFLNTSIIQTSILLSQLRAHEASPYIMLSTQLNYNPLIVSLTQYEDRKEFLVANSIESVASKLEEISALLDADIVYNWVNYSMLIGVDYLLGNALITPNEVINNQVRYHIYIYKNTPYGFKMYNTN